MGSCAGSAGTPNSGEEHRRFAWLLHGTVADVGPDHEPLVVDVRPVARLSTAVLEQAAPLSRDRFGVGRDSMQCS
nr:DUF6098 family protein [Rhodococcus pyridinivorans]